MIVMFLSVMGTLLLFQPGRERAYLAVVVVTIYAGSYSLGLSCPLGAVLDLMIMALVCTSCGETKFKRNLLALSLASICANIYGYSGLYPSGYVLVSYAIYILAIIILMSGAQYDTRGAVWVVDAVKRFIERPCFNRRLRGKG
jgi:hypothetical protein